MTRSTTNIEYFDYAGFWRNAEMINSKETMCGLPFYLLFVHLPRNHYITFLNRV